MRLHIPLLFSQREIHLTTDPADELLLTIGYPTAVNPQAVVMLDPASARALRDALTSWLGTEDDDEPDREPSPADEAAWDAREDYLRGGHQ